ncbi:glycerate dehydrogenase [Clostridium cavendishii DSM 21758]|uniref:Glycerate dehydrogenase n=1 Tax=Clostridium cavendishii DSM 21758 TaxID=1121302 RepID=A0A1M6AI39_9CLOT|nr:glycerate dehydrogenase [Clostridium cavendishii DSM 21758]
MNKKIVFLEGNSIGNMNFDLLKEFGELYYYDNTQLNNLEERIKDANIILVNKLLLNEKTLKEANKLELICEVATGYNNIDIDYARKMNIAVTNVAGYSTDTVAQHTFALLLNLYNKLFYYDNYVKNGLYSKTNSFTNLGREFYDIAGKTWGIIGLGAIGKKVAKIAESFGANIIYYSTTGKNKNSEYKSVALDELLKDSDIISIHAPLNDVTKGLINYETLSKMKKMLLL